MDRTSIYIIIWLESCPISGGYFGFYFVELLLIMNFVMKMLFLLK